MASKTDVENARREVRGIYARKIMALEAERNALRTALVSVLPFVCAGSADHEVKAAIDVLYPPRGVIAKDRQHSDGGTCCECGGPHECHDCPVFA